MSLTIIVMDLDRLGMCFLQAESAEDCSEKYIGLQLNH